MCAVAHRGQILKLEASGVVEVLLPWVAASREISRDGDGGRNRVGVVILILPLVLEAAFVHSVIVDHHRVAQLHRVVGVRLVRGRIHRRRGSDGQRTLVQIAVLGLGPETIARRERVLGAQLPIDAHRGSSCTSRRSCRAPHRESARHSRFPCCAVPRSQRTKPSLKLRRSPCR